MSHLYVEILQVEEVVLESRLVLTFGATAAGPRFMAYCVFTHPVQLDIHNFKQITASCF
jgi:hypothetical protein